MRTDRSLAAGPITQPAAEVRLGSFPVVDARIDEVCFAPKAEPSLRLLQ